jgi:phage anti-repressor protein
MPDYILNGDQKVEPRNGLVEMPVVELVAESPVENGVKEFIEISTRTIGGESVNSVSARDLDLDLGLNEVNWARWSQTNIVENMFFKRDVDFIELFTMKSKQGRGNSATNYAVTIEMAKHLAMMAKTQHLVSADNSMH